MDFGGDYFFRNCRIYSKIMLNDRFGTIVERMSSASILPAIIISAKAHVV